jgi:hypothetical protein
VIIIAVALQQLVQKSLKRRVMKEIDWFALRISNSLGAILSFFSFNLKHTGPF